MITEVRSGRECQSLHAAYSVIIQVASVGNNGGMGGVSGKSRG